MKRFCIAAMLVVIALGGVSPAQTAQSKFTINDLLKVRRVGDPQISPDGRWVAYVITDMDKTANRGLTQIYLVSTDGGEPRQLTKDAKSSSAPRWSPDGKRLAFISSREGGPQIWTMDVASGEMKKVSSISTGASDPIWSPDGRYLAFVSDIFPECGSDECNKEREAKMEESKVKAKIADRLLYRHWTTWKEGRRTHVFVVPSEGGAARDMTPGDYDAPPFSLGGPTDYAFSPDSKELAFARNTDKVEATSTNGDIFIVPVAGGDARRITESNRGADLSPQYSPDGRYIAYRSQARAGFESDRWRLMLYDRQSGQSRELMQNYDAYVDTYIFSPDGKYIYFVSGERGRQPVYAVAVAGGAPTKVLDGFNDDLKFSADGKTLVFSRSSAVMPTEIFLTRLTQARQPVMQAESAVVKLTKTNDAFLAAYQLPPAEETTWTGGEGAQVHGWILKPAQCTTANKCPMIVLIHGGPQGAWNDSWGYRWNPQIFASEGYVVFMPNPRGSIGYGQKFLDEISGDWGGKIVTDIFNGVENVINKGYVDKNRLGAAGGSYGGYMVNWIEGHNTDPRFQFKALVSHAGVYNLASMYGATEELWFTDWEFKGTPWDNPEMYARWSPNMFVKNFKTPMLVVHGELDYRVPVTEGLQLFTALQRMNVDSRLLYYPDEGHWILKPQNSELWYTTVLGWFDKYLKRTA
jgi:dipeptidyl aminopeptidase/acylaminoacyl peptidase